MIEERFRLVFLSKNSTDIKQISLTFKKFILFCTIFTILFSGLIVLTIGAFTHLYHNYRITSLENDREHLQKELLTLKNRVSMFSSHLSRVEDLGDQLRNVANLDPIDNDTRQVGVGGPAYNDASYFLDEVDRTASEVKYDLNKLERELLLERASMDAIEAKLNKMEDQRNHFPSINPIMNGRITSRFGWRIHPLLKRNKMHEGIDIPMRPGTAVLAVADGRVRVAKRNYKLNYSYGKEIVIDHGYGYLTRYAHLSKVLVKKGQKVTRWEKIGEVGDTGLTQGYHLHYEVIYNGKTVDPEHYIIKY